MACNFGRSIENVASYDELAVPQCHSFMRAGNW
jgi:hypothetical protein